ncbi:VOC family protein [Phycicoccus flavus]|uniref:VOC family protein n=1 Tax=Phycicoccus flavus TaxID=2502783 RepID=UPI000FEC1AC9|nr:VOC family protein [Phycicoccus flavus]NHA69179.1 VOC family protein [Phycicoccus flavus]
MELENIALDAADPARLGRFWAALLGAEVTHESPDLLEARVAVPGGPWLDLCLPRVSEAAPAHPRLHLDISGGRDQDEMVARALALGARHLDIGQGDVPWVVLADPEGNPFCVMEDRPAYRRSGPVAALPLDSADPQRDLAFWTAVSGWVPAGSEPVLALRHPSGSGPLLELCPEPRPKEPGTKNRLHLDVRLAADDDPDAVLALALELGATPVEHDWGPLPWQVLRDPSGNEVCLLPAHR